MKKKALSLALALASCLALATPALADQSTTNLGTAYKDLSPNTEIYAVTDTPGSDYPYYGAMYEPTAGVRYGRTGHGDTLANGSFGMANLGEMENESIVSHYYSLNDPYSLEYWSYLYGPALESGTRAFLVYLNFSGEGNDCPLVTSGYYDGKLTETFTYLSTLSCPVFIRIGGEMNVWNVAAQPADYIAAYRHVAALGRGLAPNVAMVFSPSYSGPWNVDNDIYYPGDEYVDWIGVSLYYDRDLTNGLVKGGASEKDDKFYGIGAYCDAMLNVQQTINLSRLHKKPVIISEGGSANKCSGEDTSAWAAGKIAKAYSFLPMVYPEIKYMVASDYGKASGASDYTFYNNSVVTSAYRQATEANPTLVHRYQAAGSYYTKLSAYTGEWNGVMRLAAYSFSLDKPAATWAVDGQGIATVTEYPYAFTLDVDKLSAGEHTIAVYFSDGNSKSYTFTYSGVPATPTQPDKPDTADFEIENGVLTKYIGGGGDVTIPGGVTSIGDRAFVRCTGLTGVTIPDGVTSIGEGAFYGCSRLAGVTIPNSVTSIGESAFYGCSALAYVSLPSGITSIGKETFHSCTALTGVTIPYGVTSIGYGAFTKCSALTSVAIPNSVTSTGEYAFSECTGLTSVVLPDSLTGIGGLMFYGCTGLTSVTIPNNLTSIPLGMFYGCTSLDYVDIPNSVTAVGSRAFMDCTGLTSIGIPVRLIGVAQEAFQGCTGLTDIYYGEGEPLWNAITVWADNDALRTATVHYNSTLPARPTQPVQPGQSGQTGQAAQAMPTNDKLTVNGVLQTPTVYKIDGGNYFKLRDLAVLLNGTSCQFDVGYDAATNSVTADSGKGYTKLDTDMQGPASGSQTAILSNDKIIVNGQVAQVEVYKIDGGNYFKLRDLGTALGFGVGWDDANKVASITTNG